MHPDIHEFLKKLEVEVPAVGLLQNRIQEEISTFTSVRETLLAARKTDAPDDELNLLDQYLQNLQLAGEKFKHTHLALLNQSNTEQEAAVNRQVLRILKNLNTF